MARSRIRSVALMATLALAPDTALAGDTPLDVTVTKAPVAPDGTTAGAVTDFVLTVLDRDPDVEGLALPLGTIVEIDLPPAFENTGSGDNTVIILQGWPQSPIVPFPYDLAVDGNRITLTLTSDFMPGSDGEGGPGPKQFHLLLEAFRNPHPGSYDIALGIDLGNGDSYSGTGNVRILPKARPSVNIVNFLSGGGPPPPFNNAVYQDLALGESGLLTRLFVWNKNSVPYVEIDLHPTANPNLYRFRRGNRTVGLAWIEAPVGASGYALTTAGPSVSVPNPVTGVPTAGLDAQFHPDADVPGNYCITYRLNNGNTERQFIRVL